MRAWEILLWTLVLTLAALSTAGADTVVSARPVRAMSVIGPDDLTMIAGDTPGAAAHLSEVLGKEARVMLYPGRPIRLDQIGPPALIERNQIVTLIYSAGGLTIATEARSLGRAGLGDVVRVMNLASRKTVSGKVQPDGSVAVGF
ncbi:flagellar basal body P-ring formation chaperone FlgA [Frigidibacter sp. ROC022]|uniref:flagellar basal body P-ring formation chaperone FlgA n=1 Tax=Frigidibacter sp. ROC022 TaxID=2971796 RepID=UPI00215AAB1E|nr:flagellar basal body P-ring formation chaperone FlgA [Frigidibacter sp. ROC022]MCR8724365.1 flagellar basal body P-ring formation chaperone FlgA [Frigidibacter sp. ROC022]